MSLVFSSLLDLDNVFGEEDHESKMPFECHRIRDSYLQHDLAQLVLSLFVRLGVFLRLESHFHFFLKILMTHSLKF